LNRIRYVGERLAGAKLVGTAQTLWQPTGRQKS
jgi:hypothetical protein